MVARRTIENYLAALASNASTPGGGAAAGMAGAQAAALISMVCRLTRTDTEVIAEILPVADKARDRFIQLIDEDIQSFDEVMKAYKGSAKTDEEKAHRSTKLQQSLKDAATAPLEMIDEAVKLIPVTSKLVEIGNRNLITDIGIAASLLECAISSSRLNILVNLKAIDDKNFTDNLDAKLASAIELIDRIDQINDQVEVILQQS